MNTKTLRAPWHDYQSCCIYMVTINKAPGVENFGILAGDTQIPIGNTGSPFISSSPIGTSIKAIIRNFRDIEPAARILQYALMPDHLHLLIHIEERTEKTLGQIMAQFKTAVNNKAGMDHVFDNGFNDQILKPGRKLDVLFKYLQQNPYRLAVRRNHPKYFQRLSTLSIGGRCCQAYGNIQLLDNPFKEQVVIHRADSVEKRERNRQLWLYTAANGGVLVSPFISPDEKLIRKEAETFNGSFILITHEPFGERYKPTGHNFDLCNAGRLLLISPLGLPDKHKITRQQALFLNQIAATIASGKPTPRRASAESREKPR